jgi:sec-independent protein translocase protein TatC
MAVFVSAVVGAIATPVAEPMAMFLLMIPLLILYFLAAGIAYLHDKRVAKKLATLELADPQAAE